jgi:signal transduction histidine kinase
VSGRGEDYLHSGELPSDSALVAHFSRESDLGPYRIDVGAPVSHLSAVRRPRVVTTYLAFGASVLLVLLAIVQARREQALTRLREAFVAGVSHELRTPLAQIRLYAEMLQHGFVRNTAERDDAVRVIVQESARLTHLIENVLAYSRGVAPGTRVPCRPVPVGDVFEQVRQSMGALAGAAGIRLTTRADVDAVARSEPTLLGQVLVNFVDNAIRHGVGSHEIRLGAERRSSVVHVPVDDGGPGIPPHERGRVWERFVRLEARTPSPGNGIGLAVAASLVERLGGSTWIEDAPGGGARFVVQLPAVDDASAVPSQSVGQVA